MTEQLVAHIRLRRVVGHRRMTDVLRGVEDAEGEAGEKVARREQTGHRSQTKAGAVLEEVGHVLELRYVVLAIAAVLLQKSEDVVELVAGVRRIQLSQLSEDDSPITIV